MEQLVLNWRGPFRTKDSVPNEFRGWPGLYLIEYNSEILYIGKAETEGALKRAKDHFKGQGDSTGRWICDGRNESQIQIWVAKKEWNELISYAEKLLIFRLAPHANVNHTNRYKGKPLHIINLGEHPKHLPSEIKHPRYLHARMHACMQHER